MFKNPSFLFDILCTVVWLVLMVRYARKGFLASIVQLSGNLISLLGARQCSAACAGWVFENLLAGGFRTQIAAHLSEDGVVNLSGIAQQYAGFLPESFRASIVAACERSINAVLADNAVVLADTIVEKVLQPLLTPVIMLVLFFAAGAIAPFVTPEMLQDFISCGGVLTIVAGMRVSGIKQYPIANMIPALLLVLPASAIWQTLMV